jgi:hypothetical protein
MTWTHAGTRAAARYALASAHGEPTSSHHIVLLALTCIVTVLTVVPPRHRLQAGVHLALLAAYVFLAIRP